MLLNLLIYLIVPYIFYALFIRRIPSRFWRWAVFLPVLLVVTLIVAPLARLRLEIADATARNDVPQVIDTAEAIRDDLVVTVSGAGTIAPERQVILSFQAAAPVSEVVAEVGDPVGEGDLIATLDTADLNQLVADSRLAFDLQRSVYDSLLADPREADIAAAEAAVAAARASYGAASLSGPNEFQVEIARLQRELAGNALWQTQLQRDQITIPDSVPQAFDIPPLDQNDLPGVPPDVIDDINQGIGDVEELINAPLNASAQQAIQAAEAQRRQLEQAIPQVEIGVEIADANFQSVQSRGPDMGSLASANAQLLQAQIALDRLLEGPDAIQLERANLDLELAELALELAEYNLSQSQMVAPFAGIVAENNLVEGQVPPQGIAVRLIDASTLYVDLPIDETEVVRIQPGQTVIFSVDALPGVELRGTVVRVPYTPVQIGQLVTYPVRVELEPVDERVRVDMSVTAQIIVQERDQVVLVPNRFVRIDRNNQTAIITVETSPGRYIERSVQLGERNDQFSEVIGGLEPGEQVVLLRQNDTTAAGIFGGN